MLVRFFVLLIRLACGWLPVMGFQCRTDVGNKIRLNASHASCTTHYLLRFILIKAMGFEKRLKRRFICLMSFTIGATGSEALVQVHGDSASLMSMRILHIYSPFSGYLSVLNAVLGMLFRKIKIKLRNFLSFHNIISLRDLYAY